jgi:hypothetical protein
MSIEVAEKSGRRETLKWTLYTFLVIELVFMLIETNGDFANGIIFFIEGHKNVHYLAMVTILFAVTYLVGQRNGKEILILGRHFFITPFKYGLLTIWIVLAYGSVVGLLKQNNKDAIGTFEMIRSYILVPYIRTTLILLIPLAIYSYYCGDRIKRSNIDLEKK